VRVSGEQSGVPTSENASSLLFFFQEWNRELFIVPSSVSVKLVELPLRDIEWRGCGGAKKSDFSVDVEVEEDGSPASPRSAVLVVRLSVAYLFCISRTFSSVVMAVQRPKSESFM
jgi:hypothetical protein